MKQDNEIITDSQKELVRQNILNEINIKIDDLNVDTNIKVKNLSELTSLVKLVKNDQIDFIPKELAEFVLEKDIELSETLLTATTDTPQNQLSNFELKDETYDIEYEKTKFFLDLNSKLKNYGVPSEFTINNHSDFDSFNLLVKSYIPNPLIPTTLTHWRNNPQLKDLVETKEIEYEDLINPEMNSQLAKVMNINENLGKIKDILNLAKVPTLEQLQNVFNLPENFDLKKLDTLVNIPNLNLTSFEDLKSMLNLPDLGINLPNLEGISIPNIASISIPSISNFSSGLNFNSMLGTLEKAQLKDFPETTPWNDVIKYQSSQIVKAVFDQLKAMTLYIEPGEIKVLTNGSPSTHQGQNINRIKIKLK